MLLFAVYGVVLFTARTASGSALPRRAFETTDLLLSKAETPPNWVFDQPYKPADHLCATDCADIDSELPNGGGSYCRHLPICQRSGSFRRDSLSQFVSGRIVR